MFFDFKSFAFLAFMPLPVPTAARTLRHTRTIVAQGYARDDGLWDLDLVLTDAKTRSVEMATFVLAPHQPIHELWLRVTLDAQLNIIDACASSDAVPYPGACDTIPPAYQVLKGLNLFKGFRTAVNDRLSGTAGCTHLTELCNILPTAAIQAYAGDVFNTREGELDATGARTAPFQLDKCHALARSGEVVKTYYPVWHTPVKPPLASH